MINCVSRAEITRSCRVVCYPGSVVSRLFYLRTIAPGVGRPSGLGRLRQQALSLAEGPRVQALSPVAARYYYTVAPCYRSVFQTSPVSTPAPTPPPPRPHPRQVSYRRNGHNEIDEPMFTHPFMYSKVRRTPGILQKYSEEADSRGRRHRTGV